MLAEVGLGLGRGEVARVGQVDGVDVEDGQVVLGVAQHQVVGARVQRRLEVQRLQRQQHPTRVATVALHRPIIEFIIN